MPWVRRERRDSVSPQYRATASLPAARDLSRRELSWTEREEEAIEGHVALRTPHNTVLAVSRTVTHCIMDINMLLIPLIPNVFDKVLYEHMWFNSVD